LSVSFELIELQPSDRNNQGRNMAVEGLTTLRSNYGPADTLARLEAAIAAKGLMIFARIDHAAGAAAAGLTMRPAVVLIFGNARGGTPLMQAVASVAIDLPLKALVWEDAAGASWVSYNDPRWLAMRHGLGHELDGPLNAMTGLLAALAQAATASS
jgi:uncharacterized protein (DUF302 family)